MDTLAVGGAVEKSGAEGVGGGGDDCGDLGGGMGGVVDSGNRPVSSDHSGGFGGECGGGSRSGCGDGFGGGFLGGCSACRRSGGGGGECSEWKVGTLLGGGFGVDGDVAWRALCGGGPESVVRASANGGDCGGGGGGADFGER